MRGIERNGVVIERCTECGGIFLDRGELERLTQAENSYVSTHTRGYRDDDDDDTDRWRVNQQGQPVPYDSRDPRYQQPVQYDKHGRPIPPKKKRRGFLEDLFDFGD
jgi:Zn-finger nucleic acid-binding protein